MFRITTVFFTLIFCYFQNAYAIEIKGRAPTYINQTIKWAKKTDYLSNQYSIIDNCKIDSIGNFNLRGEIPNSCLTELSIGMSSGFLYVDKNTKDYIILFPKDTTTSQSTLKKHFVQLIFEQLPITELNSLLLDFNLQLDYFLFGDTSKLIRMAKHEVEFQDSLNIFKIKISNRYKNYKVKYLHNYVRYEVALMEQMAHQNKGEKYRYYLYKTYLSQHTINYDNDSYMEFFNQFYDQPFRLVNQDIVDKINFSINNLNSLKELSIALENSIYFQEKKLAELAIIKGLGNAFYSTRYNQNNVLSVSGPKGKLQFTASSKINISVVEDKIEVSRINDSKEQKSLHGTTRQMIYNMIVGVTEGFKKDLTIIGVGYQAIMQGKRLQLQLGFSHDIIFELPDGINIIANRTTLTIEGIDKQLVGSVAAKIRSFRKPEPYKGKGVRYKDEYVRTKQGKTVGSK